MKKIIIFTIFCQILASCSHDDYISNSNIDCDHEDNVKRILMKFCNKNQDTRGTQNFPTSVGITRITTQHYVFNGVESYLSNQNTRSNETEFDLSLAEFIADNNTGYAIISDTPGVEGIYMFAENASTSDLISNPGVACVMNNIRNGIGAQLAGITTKPTPYPNPIPDPIPLDSSKFGTKIGPLMKTYWDQFEPFNDHYPTFDGIKAPAGCVNIALAQLIAYCGKFKSSSQETENLDLSSLASSQIPAVDLHDQVASFIYEISQHTGSIYSANVTIAFDTQAAWYLNSMGYSCTISRDQIDLQKLTNLLVIDKIPQIYSGKSSVVGGHTWIIDGYDSTKGDDSILYHCNWGWGYNPDEKYWVSPTALTYSYKYGYNFNENNATIYITSI